MRVVIVGGGVLGTMHAWHAIRRGHDVLQLEREGEARGASVRNFGLVWVSGRAGGVELTTTSRARELWQELANSVPGMGFRANGSLSVVRTDAELAVAEQACERADAGQRGFTLLTADEARVINPALRGDMRGALYCERDAVVEPRPTQRAIREHLAASGRYTFVGGREARSIDDGVDGTGVRDDTGERHPGDVVLVCPGAVLSGLTRELAPEIPVRRVRLQMMQTTPLGEPLPTSVADADSFRYYPAYAGEALDELNRVQPQHPVAARFGAQLLMVQRLDGGLTIGDTHDYDEPFGFDADEEPTEHLLRTAAELLGRPTPAVRRRWCGVYAQCVDPTELVHRKRVADAVWLITGPGGRGMTMSPAIAEHTANELGW
ncbi:MAG: TIGR03364 family FAD-dependent oxidoreductase [Sciscionella sp.]|nr:TIGR03364 family FAD-dependent oxidoreductase [Sciscionella sp.]